MNQLGKVAQITERIDGCRRDCSERGIPFHADALAAALGIPYEQLWRYATGDGTSDNVKKILASALQECTASVMSFALGSDTKYHNLVMWYLRNRAGFSDKGDAAAVGGGSVTFVGESRI